MEGSDDLKARIRDITEKISLNSNTHKANLHREVSSSIGSETPLSVLTEIRESQGRAVEELKSISQALVEADKKTEERHREMCTLLLGLSGMGMAPDASPTGTGAAQPPSGAPKYYYGSNLIKDGTYLMACILMHIDKILSSHPTFKKIGNTDSTFLDVKDWYVICSSVLNADKSAKAGLRLPKPTDEDFRGAARIVASTVPGRRPECDSAQLALLLTVCGSGMTTVEWMRSATLRCSGVLSPERTCRFRLTEHPFVTEDGELLVKEVVKLQLPVRKIHQEVMAMKVTKRKEYMRLILENSMKPTEALALMNSKS
jgi:hypothetical protein